jgi:ribonuclease P protein component
MIAKPNRLKRKKDFTKVFKKGKFLKGEGIILNFLQNKKTQSRFGIVVSQKISKKASERNKIKRRIRAAIFEKIPNLKSNFDVVIIATPSIKNESFQTIKKTINKLFQKAGIT